ncbi:hypothetical protein ACIQK5_20160 [Streptomyces virginiae]
MVPRAVRTAAVAVAGLALLPVLGCAPGVRDVTNSERHAYEARPPAPPHVVPRTDLPTATRHGATVATAHLTATP